MQDNAQIGEIAHSAKCKRFLNRNPSEEFLDEYFPLRNIHDTGPSIQTSLGSKDIKLRQCNKFIIFPDIGFQTSNVGNHVHPGKKFNYPELTRFPNDTHVRIQWFINTRSIVITIIFEFNDIVFMLRTNFLNSLIIA